MLAPHCLDGWRLSEIKKLASNFVLPFQYWFDCSESLVLSLLHFNKTFCLDDYNLHPKKHGWAYSGVSDCLRQSAFVLRAST